MVGYELLDSNSAPENACMQIGSEPHGTREMDPTRGWGMRQKGGGGLYGCRIPKINKQRIMNMSHFCPPPPSHGDNLVWRDGDISLLDIGQGFLGLLERHLALFDVLVQHGY